MFRAKGRFFLGTDNLVFGDDVGLQVVMSVSAVFTVGAGVSTEMTVIVGANMSCEVCTSGEGARAEWALET